MEAFITRDGKFLFFNNNEGDTPGSKKNIYYAKRLDDATFAFMGEIKGVNSDDVDGVPSMNRYGNLYFVSTAHFGRQNGYATVHSGRFNNGQVDHIRSHPELSLNRPGWLNMDIEISADGNTLYATQTYFGAGHPPKRSYFFTAHRTHDRFVIDARSDDIFKHINTVDLEYGAAISSDERELFFTRLRLVDGASFASYRATRTSKAAAFSAPVRIAAITGIAEAPALAADEQSLYFHKKVGTDFVLYRLVRRAN